MKESISEDKYSIKDLDIMVDVPSDRIVYKKKEKKVET